MSTVSPFEKERFGIAPCNDQRHVNVANLSYEEEAAKDHTYTVTLDSDGKAKECTCPHYRYRTEFCKHMAAVEQSPESQETTVTEHIDLDKSGESYRFFRCEQCGLETIDERLKDGCFRCE